MAMFQTSVCKHNKTEVNGLNMQRNSIFHHTPACTDFRQHNTNTTKESADDNTVTLRDTGFGEIIILNLMT